MSDNETRDAYVAVEVDLPNGSTVRGRPIPWRAGMKIKGLVNTFLATEQQEDFDTMFAAFQEATGVGETQLSAADPSLGLVELVDFINRFISRPRPGRTAAPASAATPQPQPSA